MNKQRKEGKEKIQKRKYKPKQKEIDGERKSKKQICAHPSIHK